MYKKFSMNNPKDKQLNKCNLCPRDCGKRPGFCGEGFDIRLSRAALHFYEEPLISGLRGSGAIFFTGCNLKCIFCQNNSIAHNSGGQAITTDRLTEILWELKDQGANNINLVTPSHFVPQIAKAISSARDNGFDLPFVYNSSGYDNVNTLRMLDGLIDVYLPDYKYEDSELASKFSFVPDYPAVAKRAIAEMLRQVGNITTSYSEENNCELIKNGVIVRHLVLPGHTKNSISALDYLYETYGENIIYSIMNQYTPMKNSGVENYPELQRCVTKREYEKVLNHVFELGITNAFIQEGETMKESFIPEFDLTGVRKV